MLRLDAWNCTALHGPIRTPNAKVAGWTPARATINQENSGLRDARQQTAEPNHLGRLAIWQALKTGEAIEAFYRAPR